MPALPTDTAAAELSSRAALQVIDLRDAPQTDEGYPVVEVEAGDNTFGDNAAIRIRPGPRSNGRTRVATITTSSHSNQRSSSRWDHRHSPPALSTSSRSTSRVFTNTSATSTEARTRGWSVRSSLAMSTTRQVRRTDRSTWPRSWKAPSRCHPKYRPFRKQWTGQRPERWCSSLQACTHGRQWLPRVVHHRRQQR